MKEYLLNCIDRTFDDEDYYNVMKIYEEEIKDYQKELEKADSITQSCIFAGKENSEKSFRNCLNKLTDYKSRIDKAIEYIESHSLYEEEYDYDYEENSYLSGISDEVAKKDLLNILNKEVE